MPPPPIEQRLDRWQLRKLIEEHGSSVLAAAQAYASESMTADDIFQETFTTAWMKLDPDRDPACLAGWLCKTALNIGRSHWRREERRSRLIGKWLKREPPRAPRSIGEELARRALWRAIDSLPPRQRESMIMRYVDDMAAKDIAERMGITEGTVRATLRDAHQSLRLALGVEDAAETDDETETAV